MRVLIFVLINFVDGYDLMDDEYDILPNHERHGQNKTSEREYQPNWFDLDKRPMPEWYDKAKIGFLLHWGLYSVPAFHSEWFWYWLEKEFPRQKVHDKVTTFMEKTYQADNPNFSYKDFAAMFTVDKFEPEDLAIKLREAGAKYVLITSKYHDGFALFPTDKSPKWNSWEVGPHRDLVGEIAMAVRKQYLVFGIQYSLYEWFHPKYLDDKAKKFKNRTYPDSKVWPELKSIVNRYAPSIIRAEGDREATSSYWQSENFLSWLFTKSPVRRDVVVNDRWGRDVHCEHGSYISCIDKLNPFKHKWEYAFSLDTKSWGYRRNLAYKDIVTIRELILSIADTVSCGGNVLINIGLTKSGKIPEIFHENLHYLGYWLKLNGEAIYNTSPWFHQTDAANANVRYTCNKVEYNTDNPVAIPLKNETITAVYAIFFSWPTSNKLRLKAMAPFFNKSRYIITLAGHSGPLEWSLTKTKLIINLPEKGVDNPLTLDVAWTLKFTLPTLQDNLQQRALRNAENGIINALKNVFSNIFDLLSTSKSKNS